MHLFGEELSCVAKKEPDGIPFIIKMCTLEIEKTALCLQGIYRVSGNKAKMAILRQALENGRHLVDLSEFSSHDICEVLKFYLQQLPEPLVLFQWYQEFMELANIIQHINQEQDTKRDNSEDNTSPNMCMEINQILLKTKDLLRQLPPSNFNTLHYLIIHLKMVVDHSEENLMNSKNLEVVFGPCLMRPRPTTTPGTISSSLVAYANQALLVEFLITNAQRIFDGSLEPQNASSSTDVVTPWVDKSPPSKPVISTEHSTKSQYFSTKQDIHTADIEIENFELATSFEESECKQNALEKWDACLIDHKELESSSQKMDNMCKTTKPLSLKSDVTTNDIQRPMPSPKIRCFCLPVDRFHLASSPNEKNSRNVGIVNSDKFCQNLTFEGLNRKDTPTSFGSQINGFDQQIPQKTQGQQCEPKNLTGTSAVIVPSVLQERGTMSIKLWPVAGLPATSGFLLTRASGQQLGQDEALSGGRSSLLLCAARLRRMTRKGHGYRGRHRPGDHLLLRRGVQEWPLEIISNDQGNRLRLFYVAFTPEEERLIHNTVKNQLTSNPENMVFDAQRLIGSPGNDPSVKKTSSSCLSKCLKRNLNHTFRLILEIEVTFEIHVNAILWATAEDKGTENKNNITITNDQNCLTPEEIEKMVNDVEKFAEEDKRLKECIDTRNELESYAYSLKYQIGDKEKLGSKLSSEDKETMEKAVEEKIEWLQTTKKLTLKTSKLKRRN
ncbi:Hypothetical predicted protein [Marmota monax]|uniref:Rho-GAP domain-containing protein n=1 Tax=Marmota monax TaxID=9995 RepID=A0A5E4BRC5_MARMO|nr:Hypothetical predicted protein [Marmota monax]